MAGESGNIICTKVRFTISQMIRKMGILSCLFVSFCSAETVNTLPPVDPACGVMKLVERDAAGVKRLMAPSSVQAAEKVLPSSRGCANRVRRFLIAKSAPQMHEVNSNVLNAIVTMTIMAGAFIRTVANANNAQHVSLPATILNLKRMHGAMNHGNVADNQRSKIKTT
jgi:hypothetical protein